MIDKNGWNHDMSEAPRDETPLLLWVGGEQLTGCYEQGYAWGWACSRGHYINPTAWRPLPEPPVTP